MAKSKLSPALHEEFNEKLGQLLDDQDDVREKKARITKALGGELKIIADAIARTRRVLKGIESPQEEIPGTEVGERKRDPVVYRLLEAADRLSRAKEQVKTAHPGATAEARVGGKKFPIGPSLEKSVPPPLSWRVLDGRERKATVDGGVYQLVQDLVGTWAGVWVPMSGGGFPRPIGNRKTLVLTATEADAAEACEKHHLERQADGLLRNAGAGELTKADTKGPAVARKKGGRRA